MTKITHGQIGVIIASVCLVGIITTINFEMFELTYYFVVSMIVSGFAILAYTLTRTETEEVELYNSGGKRIV